MGTPDFCFRCFAFSLIKWYNQNPEGKKVMKRERLLKAIEVRHSCRTYSRTPLDESAVAAIKEIIQENNEISGFDFELIEDGSKAFSSFFRTYGSFKNVRAVILIKGKKDIPKMLEQAGYFGEDIVLSLTDLKLGTCWVGGTYDPKKFIIPEDEKLVAVITVGIPMDADFFKKPVTRKRKSYEKRYSSDTDEVPQWLKDGAIAVQKAPSALNSQKAVFVYDSVSGHVEGTACGRSKFDDVDLGIAERHFAIGADRNITTAYFAGILRDCTEKKPENS